MGVGCTSGQLPIACLQVCLKAKSLSLGTAERETLLRHRERFGDGQVLGSQHTEDSSGSPLSPLSPPQQVSSTPQDVDLKLLKSTDDATLAASIVALTISGGPWASADTWSTEEADLYETDQKVMYLVNGEVSHVRYTRRLLHHQMLGP